MCLYCTMLYVILNLHLSRVLLNTNMRKIQISRVQKVTAMNSKYVLDAVARNVQ